MFQSRVGGDGMPLPALSAGVTVTARRVDHGVGGADAARRPVAARTALEHFRGGDLARYEALLAGARRVRRYVPRGTPAGMVPGEGDTTTEPPRDDVRIVALRPALSIKTRYSTTEVLDAVAAGANPFESLAALGADMSAYGAGEIDPVRRATILRIGAIFDTLTNLDPRTYGCRNAFRVFGTASKLLKGGHADAADMLDVVALERSAMGHRLPDTAADEWRKVRDETAPPVARERSVPERSQEPGRSDIQDRPALVRMEEGAAVAAARAPAVVVSERRMVPRVGDATRAEPPAEVMRAGAGTDAGTDADREMDADANLDAGAGADAERPSISAPVHPSEVRLLARPVSRASLREDAPLQRGDDPAPLAATRFTWRLNAGRERGSFEDADTAYDMTRGPLLYTRVGDVPLLGRRAAGGTVYWEGMPLSEYAAAVAFPGGSAQRFEVSGQAYMGIDGMAYRVREIAPGTPWIVHEHSGWPPLPLVRDGAGRWVLKVADRTPVDVFGNIASDGFLRIANRKFIRVDGAMVEIAKNGILAEENIRRFAHPEMRELGPADGAGIIHRADGVELIEGRHGYYPLRRDGEGGPHYVGGEGGKHWMRFDAARKRWLVVPGSAAPREAVENPAESGGGDTATGMHRLSPAARRESVRKNSDHSIDSVRRYRDRIGKIDFLQARPLLRAAVDEAFQGIVDLHVRRPNRLLPGGADLSTVISMRRNFFRTTYQTEKWNMLTIQQKQRFVAEKVFNFYAQGLYISNRPNDALCHEMTDFMTAQLMQSAALRAKILQIEFRELPGSGLGHAAVLYADDASVLGRFGRLDETDAVRQQERPRLNRADFLAFVHANRNKVLLIDPWGLEKIVDFSAMTSAEASAEALDVNLRAAGFGAGLTDHYRVAALVPELPKGGPGLGDGVKSRSGSLPVSLPGSLPDSPTGKGFPLPERRGTSERARRLPLDIPKHGQ